MALTGLTHLCLQYSKGGNGAGAVAHPDMPKALSFLLDLQHLNIQGLALPTMRRSSGATPPTQEDPQRNVFGLRNLTSLQHLELSSCKLSRAPLGAVADTLAALSSLTHIDISCNGLTTRDLGQMLSAPRRSLSVLMVEENEFSIDSFLAAVPIVPGLKTLNLGKLAVESVEASEGLSKIQKIRTLSSLTVPVGEALGEGGLVPRLSNVLRSLTGLTSLGIQGALDDMMLMVIAPELERLTLLQELSLDVSNYILDEETMHHRAGSRTYHPLQQALTGTTELRKLTLYAGQWTFTMRQTWRAFAAGVAGQPHLTRVDLNFTHQAANRSAYRIIDGLAHVPSLQHLSVQAAGTGIVDTQEAPFMSAIRNLTNLQVLDLSNALDCTYNTGGSSVALGELQKLRLLDLSNCRLGSAFAVNLAVCVEPIQSLEKLDVSGNDLSYNGAHALAAVMKGKARAEVLDIAGNAYMYQAEYMQLRETFPFINW